VKISLVRHGRPLVDIKSRITAGQFAAWLSAYESAAVDPSFAPPTGLIAALRDCALVLTSPAPRATGSAELLKFSAPVQVCAEASEAPLPARLRWPLRMRPASFTALARIWWLLGLVEAHETVREVRRRAARVAHVLAAHALQRGHVALVSHGYFIRFLSAELRSSGWHRSRNQGCGYWSHTQLEKPSLAARESGQHASLQMIGEP
jgi:hypothetical protein